MATSKECCLFSAWHNKALDKSRKTLEEPKHVLVCRWFKTWKMFKYETSSQQNAYDKFNSVMEQLSQHNNVVIDVKRSRVILKNIAPVCLSRVDLKYVVEVYWRDNETI